jgi:hypothetical protein
MFNKPRKNIQERTNSLRAHLANENPLLVNVISSFQELDRVAYRLGLLDRHESYANKIAWWPMISMLGTFSAGKSTFINQYTGLALQSTGNQAVDDKFTVICYSQDKEVRVLPGLALDADPRFPFYQISEEIEKVATGEGGRVDTYLQLKTCPSDRLRGKILIDSPGFDADQQRNSTLRITDHIIDLSDLVLVFFDARHPEPGAMQDTLEHLVSGTVRRSDANKVLFILNQIDTTAREDNAEAVIAAWQRALAQCGLASGRFYTIYNEEAAVPIDDDNLKQRYRSKRDADLADIYQRISQVSVERVYRIIGAVENTANQIEHKIIPTLRQSIRLWHDRVLTWDGIVLIPLLMVLLGLSINAGYWQGFTFAPPWLEGLGSPNFFTLLLGILLIIGVIAIHFWIRKRVAHAIARRLANEKGSGSVAKAFLTNTHYWRSIFQRKPLGWNRFNKKHVIKAREAADHFVQILNDQYTNPSGGVKEYNKAAIATTNNTSKRDGEEET